MKLSAGDVPELETSAVVDFACFEADCGGVVKFPLQEVLQPDFQAVCPVCHRSYTFDAALRDKLQRLFELVLSLRRSEDILSNTCVSVSVANGEVKIPYALLLTRLNTRITLEMEGRKTDLNLRVEPMSKESFR